MKNTTAIVCVVVVGISCEKITMCILGEDWYVIFMETLMYVVQV